MAVRRTKTKIGRIMTAGSKLFVFVDDPPKIKDEKIQISLIQDLFLKHIGFIILSNIYLIKMVS